MENGKIEIFRKDLLTEKKLGLDSMCFLYQFADSKEYAPFTTILFDLLEKKKIQAVTSTVTLVETFVQIEKAGDQLLIHEYEKFFQGLTNLEMLAIDWYVARLAAKLRALYNFLRTPDALQLAATLLKDYSAFLTNDKRLKKLKELNVLLLDEYV